MTRNVPIDQFQNRVEDQRPYDFNAPPQGMFLSIATAHGVEEAEGPNRTHALVAVDPAERFPASTPIVYIVFQLHQHYQGFKVFGLCVPEAGQASDPAAVVSADTMDIALEDDSGFLQLAAPRGGWEPGPYKVEIHVGEQISELTLMGTMRFAIDADSRAQTAPAK
ncbi:MAG: hypothetical protein U0172_12645 [Nitrospiraceae bacterium]